MLEIMEDLNMSKGTFYFSHDYNTRSDEKIKKLIRTHGMSGYGIFWGIIEDLYQNNNTLKLDYDFLAYEYRVTEEIIKSIINDFGLFISDENSFGSKAVAERIDIRNERAKIATENAYKRWGKSDARQQPNDTMFYIIKMFSDDEEFIKCGITNETVSRRFSGKTGIYSYELIKSYDIDCETALNLEREICEKFDNYLPLNKFGGYLECYKSEDLVNIIETCECKGFAIKERKGKENKGKDIKDSLKDASIVAKIAALKLKDLFNAEHGTQTRIVSDKTIRQLKALIEAGYTVENVIEASKELKKEKWLAERNFKELNIEFITRPDKMEKYYNQFSGGAKKAVSGANEYVENYLKELKERNEQGNS